MTPLSEAGGGLGGGLKAQFRNGRALYYRDVGRGDPPLLFVHGTCCDHTYFSPQTAYFKSAHRVLAVDLSGHGASDKPQREYTISGFADDLVWLMDQLDLRQTVVVGHSMGGGVAVEMAARYPHRVRAVVALDATLLPTPDYGLGTPAVLSALKSNEYQDALRRLFQGFFEPYDDPEIKAAILEQVVETPRHAAVSMFENIGRWDGAAAVQASQAPLLYIAANNYRTGLRRLKEFSPRLVSGQVVGSGHFLQLMVPDQVNLMIQRFLEMLHA